MARAGLGDHGFRLLNQFEPGPGGKIATVAYRCPGGKYTLGLGATEYEDGRAIQKGDTCSTQRAIDLTNWSVGKFLDVVDRSITAPMAEHQRDAFTLMAYNTGPDAFADSSVTDRFNALKGKIETGTVKASELENVAYAFGMWCKATSSGPEKADLDERYYQEIIGHEPDGDPIWVGPAFNPPAGHTVIRGDDQFYAVKDGEPDIKVGLGLKPCKYQRAFPGLLRRHLSEALLFLGYDWPQAARKETVSIASYRVWDPADRRWEDRVRSKTELPDILMFAKAYPLPNIGGKGQTPIAESPEAVEPFPQLPAATEPPALETSPAATPDSPADILFEQAAPDVASASSGKGGGGPPASQPEGSPLPAEESDTPLILGQPDTPEVPDRVPAPEFPGAGREAGVPRPPATEVEQPLAPAALPPKVLPPPAQVEAKNPLRSQTIWGGMLTALAPQLDQIGNILMAKSAQFGPPFLALGIVMIILGRIGAMQPLSNSAPVRSQS